MTIKTLFVSCLAVVSMATSAMAAYVTPAFAGGQQTGPMIMPNVLFDGSNLSISGVVDMMGMPTAATPVLRPLTPPDEFDPAQPFGVLGTNAYNFQYGWNLDADSQFLPVGSSIWIEKTAGTPGLLTYAAGTYTPIFGTAGSSNAWAWNGVMAHNAYAAPAGVGAWSAAYRLYLGDSAGVALPGYGAATITLNWTSVPEPASLALLGGGLLALLRRPRHG